MVSFTRWLEFMVPTDADGLGRTEQRTLLQLLQLDKIMAVVAVTYGIYQPTSAKDRHHCKKLVDSEKIHLACTTSRRR